MTVPPIVPRDQAQLCRDFVCAECRHARLFAVLPQAICACDSSPFAHQVLFAGQPACALLDPQESAVPLVTWRAATGGAVTAEAAGPCTPTGEAP